MSDEDFETQRGAVHTQIAQKDVNLAGVAGRMWGHLATHGYCFDQQAARVEALKSITKAQVQALFERVFFSDQTRRIDLLLTSTAHAEENAEYRQANATSDTFKDMDRTVHTGSHGQFKK